MACLRPDEALPRSFHGGYVALQDATTLAVPLAVHNIATALPLGLLAGPIAGITDNTQAPDILHDQLMGSCWFFSEVNLLCYHPIVFVLYLLKSDH